MDMISHQQRPRRQELVNTVLIYCRLARLTPLGLLTLMLCFFACPVAAQNIQYTNNLADKTKRSSFRVDPSTLGLNVEIPIFEYPGRAGTSLPITLNYSSKLWRMKFVQGNNGNPGGSYTTWASPTWGEHTLSGWTNTLEVPTFIDDTSELYDGGGAPSTTCGSACRTIRKVTVQMPDGSTHVLRHTTPVALSSASLSGTYYAIDGSGLKYEYDTKTLYLPDGSKYVLGYLLGPPAPDTTYTDRNGNTLTLSVPNGLWKDTLGRTFAPLPTPTAATSYPYTLHGVEGASRPYSFVWKALGDALTDTSQQPAYLGDCAGIDLTNPPAGLALFQSWNSDSACAETPGTIFNPLVLSEIVLPDNTSYKFTYNLYGEIDKVVYPTGGYERFVYDWVEPIDYVFGVYSVTNRGVKDHYISATGSAADEKHWHYEAGYVNGSRTQPYKVTITAPPPDPAHPEVYTVTERYLQTPPAAPNPWGFGDPRIGRVYDERVLSSAGQMLSRTLTQWVASPEGVYQNARDARVAKTVAIMLDTDGSDALTKTIAYTYDADLNVVATADSDYVSLNKTTARSAAIGSISAGAVLRTSETTFLVNDPAVASGTRAAYRARNLIRLPSSTRTRDTALDVVAQSEVKYDEPNPSQFIITPYSAVTSWVDPQTTVRGNPTTSRFWQNTTNSWLETHAQYDQCGSLRLAWDASDTSLLNPSQTEYASTYHYAYPTTVTTSAPDPDNTGRGRTTGLVTHTTYDTDTGHVTSTLVTDASAQPTTFEYDDPFDRLTKENRPDGGWTSHEYGRMTQAGVTRHYVRTRTALDASRSTDSYQFLDGLGRTSRSYVYDGSSPDRLWAAAKTTYDDVGRVWKTSNPIFATALDDFTPAADTITTTVYDFLGRTSTVTMPDGAVVTTEHAGNEVTVTDQAGMQRSSTSDALGRVVKVVEAPGVTDYGYETAYEYDVLGNLKQVTQGKAGQAQQTRLFTYDSLSRLLTAQNPESGTARYEYDNVGNLKKKIDARHVQTDYTYDALNRITKRVYSIEAENPFPTGYVATPEVNYFYDGTGMPSENGAPLPTPDHSAGKLTAVKSAASDTVYTKFDGAGHVERHRQIIDPGMASEQTYLMEYGYDLAGNLTTEKYPSGKVFETAYDGAGRVSGVKQQATGFYYAGGASGGQIQYAAHGAVEALKLGNGLWEHTTFNSRLQPEQTGLGNSTADWGKLRLTYDYGQSDENNGNVRSQRIEGGGLDVTQTYTYDFVNRLEAAWEAPTAGGANTWKQTYTYLDAAGQNGQFGNRRIKTGTDPMGQPLTTPNATPQSNPTINPLTNRFADNQGYAYDAAGNLRQDPAHSYSYDGENKIVAVDGGWNGTTGANYSYDGANSRVKKVSASESTIFVYDVTGRVVAEYSNQVQANGTRYLTQDQLGSARVVTDAQGNADSNDGATGSRHDYLPFGEEIGLQTGGRTTGQGYSQSDDVRQGFGGYEKDSEIGLEYAKARYYSSVVGRFTSSDPLLSSAEIEDPQTWNRYTYTLNNPLKYIDPSGLYVFTAALGGSQTDAQLRAGAKTDEERKQVEQMIRQRDQFRDALAAGRAAANDPTLTASQRAALQRAVNSYGDFNDGKHDNVVVGLVANKGDTPITALGARDGNIHVDLNFNLTNRNPVITVAHEGSHVADFQDYLGNRSDPDLAASYDLNLYYTEDRAYFVSSYMAQSVGEKSYYPGEDEKHQIWNKGWKESEREMKRSLGVIRYNPWRLGIEQGGLIRATLGPKMSTQVNNRY